MASMSPLKSASVTFDIEWQDPCSVSELQAPFFFESSISIELYTTLEIEYSSMEDLTNGAECGGYTNTLVYLDGPALDNSQSNGADLKFLSSEDLGAGSIRTSGLLDDPVWIGEHTL